MQIFEFQIAGVEGLAQFDVVVGNIAVVVAFINDEFPVAAVVRRIDAILVVEVIGAVILARFVVVIVYLNGAYVFGRLEV